MDFEQVKAGLIAAVPLVRTMNIQFDELSADRAVLSLPDNPDFHNHAGGPHAGAIFSLGESASGAIVIAAFQEQLARSLPLAGDAKIEYKALAMGDVSAEAVLGKDPAEVVAELDSGQNGRFPVAVTLRNSEGKVCAEMTVTWVLRLNRS
jgi:acyl-coenzyme A thioesterase PaaI-like protein